MTEDEYESVKDSLYEYITSNTGNIYSVLGEYRQMACVDNNIEATCVEEDDLDTWARDIVSDLMSYDNLRLQEIVGDLMISQFRGDQTEYRDAIDRIFYDFKTN